MKARILLLMALGVVALAGCGGTHTTEPANTGSRNVTKPLARPIVVTLRDGSARLRPVGSKTTAVSIQLAKSPKHGATAELAKGSCGTPNGLQTVNSLGSLSARR